MKYIKVIHTRRRTHTHTHAFTAAALPIIKRINTRTFTQITSGSAHRWTEDPSRDASAPHPPPPAAEHTPCRAAPWWTAPTPRERRQHTRHVTYRAYTSSRLCVLAYGRRRDSPVRNPERADFGVNSRFYTSDEWTFMWVLQKMS